MSYGQPPTGPYNPNPYLQSGPSRPTRRGGIPWWVWVLMGAGGMAVLACCGVCGGILYLGGSEIENEVAAELRDNPALVEHIGELEDLSYNFNDTYVKYAEEDSIEVFDVRGSKGSGKITVSSETSITDELEIIWAKLETDSGDEVTLVGEPEF